MKWALVVLFLLTSPLSAAQVYQTQLRVAQAPRRMWGDNTITSTHECIHWVNSQLRNRWGRPCFYTGAGTFVLLRSEPRTTLATVARQTQYRGGIYSLYLVEQQQDWNQQPSYLIDEWSAYLGASRVAIRQDPACWSEVLYALELAYYSSLLPESTKDVWRHLATQTLAIADQANREKRCYSVRQNAWREWLRRELAGTNPVSITRPTRQALVTRNSYVQSFQGGSS